jgi:DNA ligase 1
VNEKDL